MLTPFGQEVERLRRERGLKQYEVAKAVGVTYQCLQNWLHGYRGKAVDLMYVKKLADALGGDYYRLVTLLRPDIKVDSSQEFKVTNSYERDFIEKVLGILRGQDQVMKSALKTVIDLFHEKKK